jgi:TolA-binding protein
MGWRRVAIDWPPADNAPVNRLGGFLALAALVLGCQPSAAQLVDQAKNHDFSKEPEKALASYERALLALGRDETDAARALRAKSYRGAGDICYLDLHDYLRAVEFYRKLTEAYPEAPEAFQARANLYDILRSHGGDRRTALAELASLVQSFPNHADVDRYQYLAAKDYFDLADYQQARIEAKALLDRFPNSGFGPEAQYLIGSAFAFENRRSDAVNAFLALIAKWPDNALVPRARLEMGKLYADGGDLDRAQEIMLAALKDHPDPRAVQSELARLRRRIALTRPADSGDHDAVWDHDLANRDRGAQ